MKFSTRSRYGLRAMVELALNYTADQPVPLSLVAGRQDLSEGYLEQLMTSLRKGGLVRSVRGAQGGYLLSRPPGQITAGDIIRCLEGPLSPTDCVNEEVPDPCERAEICVTRRLWERVRVAIADVLDNVTLEDLSRNAEEIRRSQESYMYYL
ncbi:MAG: Rrf2 family transcriptional regulator [Firmicutes bacterium]|nr:Rrf2 family transcriptional regulator [Bacillota bacterium]